MKNKVNMVFVVFFLFLICFSCGTDNKPEAAEEKITQKTDMDIEKNIVSGKDIQVLDNQINIDVSTPKSQENEILISALPTEIPGLEKRPFKFGRIFEDDNVVLTVSSEYIFENSGFLSFKIFIKKT